MEETRGLSNQSELLLLLLFLNLLVNKSSLSAGNKWQTWETFLQQQQQQPKSFTRILSRPLASAKRWSPRRPKAAPEYNH